MKIMSPNRFVFVIRLWHEDVRNMERPLELRGSVQMVNGERVLYFNSLNQVPTLLRQLTGWDGDTAVSGEDGM
ncbi:hypothetical protein MNBD_CHLOROFLEXI01-3371 [hydrothermal vent metagenome]|uniref:Uncharacterized protein n=1 Tax=hydrothermal vent metagenome TaxID=652676 RepID=A0A3B0UN88_9ZZZZ